MRPALFALALGIALAACGDDPDVAPVTVDGVDPVQTDGDLAPEAGLAPDTDLTPETELAPADSLAP